MKNVITRLLIIALTATVSVGGTMAFLANTDEDINVMTIGQVKSDQLEYERTDVNDKDDNA